MFVTWLLTEMYQLLFSDVDSWAKFYQDPKCRVTDAWTVKIGEGSGPRGPLPGAV